MKWMMIYSNDERFDVPSWKLSLHTLNQQPRTVIKRFGKPSIPTHPQVSFITLDLSLVYSKISAFIPNNVSIRKNCNAIPTVLK